MLDDLDPRTKIKVKKIMKKNTKTKKENGNLKSKIVIVKGILRKIKKVFLNTNLMLICVGFDNMLDETNHPNDFYLDAFLYLLTSVHLFFDVGKKRRFIYVKL